MNHPTLNPQDGQLIQGQSLVVRLANLVKLPHTVFAMPFAMVGVVFASVSNDITPGMIGWTILAFTAARFAAMGFNRIVDRDVDAINPRTAMREIPSGVLTVNQAKLSVLVASLLFFVASAELNRLCLMLSPLALAWVLGYSYTKRFTRWSHLWLGLGLSIAPVGGYLAVAGHWSTPWWLLCALATAVIAWSGGFDIIYALQDAEFDRKNGLRSIPSSIGVVNAIRLARTLHVVAIACLSLVAIGVPQLGDGISQMLVWIGVAFATLLLLWEHRLVHANDLSRINAAFFTMNGIISLTFFACVLIARLGPALMGPNFLVGFSLGRN